MKIRQNEFSGKFSREQGNPQKGNVYQYFLQKNRQYQMKYEKNCWAQTSKLPKTLSEKN